MFYGYKRKSTRLLDGSIIAKSKEKASDYGSNYFPADTSKGGALYVAVEAPKSDVNEVQASPTDAVMTWRGDSVLAVAATAAESFENENDAIQKSTMTSVIPKEVQNAMWRFICSGCCRILSRW